MKIGFIVVTVMLFSNLACSSTEKHDSYDTDTMPTPEPEPEPEPELTVSDPAPFPTLPDLCISGSVISCGYNGTQVCEHVKVGYSECVEQSSTPPNPLPEPIPIPLPEVTCQCLLNETQVADCIPPIVTCQGLSGAANQAECRRVAEGESLYWASQTTQLALTYPYLLDTSVSTVAISSCSLNYSDTYNDPHFLDNYDLGNGCKCFPGVINCSITVSLEQSCY